MEKVRLTQDPSRMVQVRVVRGRRDWDAFIGLPWAIYRGDPNWVPALRIAQRELFDVNRNPFFRHAVMLPLLATRDGSVVGRVMGVIDDTHNQTHGEKTAFFGYFESFDDQEVADGLLEAVADWARVQGMTRLRGPINLSTNHESGLLVEGYQDSPSVMMTYNPPYYVNLLQAWGLKQVMDLYAYELTPESRFSERLLAQAERLKQNGEVKFRAVNLRRFESELERILEIYNDAWEKNWGFVPMTRDEFRHLALDMKRILDPELLLLAEVRGKAAGFALALPDVNQVFAKLRSGKLTPLNIAKLLWHLKGPGRRKTVNRCRIVTLGVKKEYQAMGLGPLFYAEYLERGTKLGYRRGEASWILENNRPMNRALELMAGQRNKVYRIYERGLSG